MGDVDMDMLVRGARQSSGAGCAGKCCSLDAAPDSVYVSDTKVYTVLANTWRVLRRTANGRNLRALGRQVLGKQRMRSLVRLAVLPLIIGIAVSACTSKHSTNGAASTTGGDAQTLTVVQTGDFSSFDPTQLPPSNWAMYYQLYEPLTTQNAQLQPQPRLATSWTFSSDQLSLTLNLRAGVKYSDGTPFDALDLLFISKPQPDADIKTKPVGTGPFKLDQWQPGNQAVFSRSTYYWNQGLPKIQKIVVKDAPDPQSALLIFRAHQADILMQPSYIDFASLSKEADVKTATFGVGALDDDVLINVTKPPFNDIRVRQAVAYAIDRSAFVKSYFAGQGSVKCLPWVEGTQAYEATPDLARNCPQDLVKAKQLLAEAGFPNGFSTTIVTTTEGYLPGSSALAQVLQQDLGQIGIQLTINNLEAAAARTALLNKQYVLAAHVYGRGNRNAGTLFAGAPLFSSTEAKNYTGFFSPEYASLVDQATQADPDKAKSIYTQLNNYLLQQAFVITVAPLSRTFALQSSVKGLAANQDGMPLFENVTH